MDFIQFEDEWYPGFQAEGNASQFAIPFAKHYCKGVGVDIGFCREDWKFPGAIGVDLDCDNNMYEALSLPGYGLDYIYTSHCLEHLEDWVEAIEYWHTHLKKSGILFMYLPHPDQKYWKPWNNRKHVHVLHPEDVKACMEKFGFRDVHHSERDLNHSYIIVGYKA